MIGFFLSIIIYLDSVNIQILKISSFLLIVTMVGICSRRLANLMFVRVRNFRDNCIFLIVVGTNDCSCKVSKKINSNPELGYKIIGYVAETSAAKDKWNKSNNTKYKILGLQQDLKNILVREKVDEIIICLPINFRLSEIIIMIMHAHDLGIIARITTNTEDGTFVKFMYIKKLEERYVAILFREQMQIQLFIKKTIDFIVSLILLILLLPMMIIVAFLVKLTSPGPIFFRQTRVGINQRQFTLYKFRSMVIDAEKCKLKLKYLNESNGPVFKIKKDPRVTPVGRIIRKLSIDELPQLFNVLIGKMSLVGPRPPLLDEVKNYAWIYRKRLSVKPGVTCIWQISGRNNVSFERWMEMDYEYIRNWSLWLDLKILIITIPTVIFGRGAS